MISTDPMRTMTPPPVSHPSPDPAGLGVRVWGARGSLPASGADFLHYGGETCAVEVTAGEVSAGTRTIVLDAGSGAVAMGASLTGRGVREIDLFLTHLHYDHVMGLPFFAPLHDPAARLRIHVGGGPAGESDAAAGDRLRGYFREPHFPVGLGCFPASVTVHAVPDEAVVLNDVRVVPGALNHPGGGADGIGGATGYRVERDGGAFAYVTDFEHDGGAGDEAVVVLARDADLALLDATYTPDEYGGCCGWGHAHWRAGGTLAARAGVRSWGLFHHRHDRTDAALATVEAAARAEFPAAFAARTGQVFAIGGDAADDVPARDAALTA